MKKLKNCVQFNKAIIYTSIHYFSFDQNQPFEDEKNIKPKKFTSLSIVTKPHIIKYKHYTRYIKIF